MKSIDRKEYKEVLKLLRAVREEAGVSQAALAQALGRPQTGVSAIELGRIRLDLLQLNDWCVACSVDVLVFVQRFKEALATRAKRAPGKATEGTPRKTRKS